jgi:hypothetical protein
MPTPDRLTEQASPSCGEALGALKDNLCPSLQRIFEMYFTCLARIMAELSDAELEHSTTLLLDQLKLQQEILIANISKNLVLAEEMWLLSEGKWRRRLAQQSAHYEGLISESAFALVGPARGGRGNLN